MGFELFLSKRKFAGVFSGSWTTFLNLLRCTGGEDELSSVSSKSKTVKKPQSIAPDELLQVRVQLSIYSYIYASSSVLFV